MVSGGFAGCDGAGDGACVGVDVCELFRERREEKRERVAGRAATVLASWDVFVVFAVRFVSDCVCNPATLSRFPWLLFSRRSSSS